MSFVRVSKDDGIATVILTRGKVNALNEVMAEEINDCLIDLQNDEVGQGKFFSFGFDIPEFLSYPKDPFTRYLTKFTNLCTYIFLFPKPILAALNGHTMAGSCMLATACDYRIMVSGKAKISLNEIGFGSSVFASSVEILKFCVGQKNAELILCSGSLYSADEALRLGLIDQVSSEDNFADEVRKIAYDFAQKDSAAFRSIKGLLRKPIAEGMVKREKDSIREFVEIWYSEKTWQNLQEIKIHP